MDVRLVLAALFAFASSFFIFPSLIRHSIRLGWVTAPDLRRRHSRPTPISGGVGIFLSLAAGLAFFSFIVPEWASTHARSLAVAGSALGGILLLGLFDDRYRIGPWAKLSVEFALAAAVVAFEPSTHAACESIISAMPGWAQGPAWALPVLWIVCCTNAMNLIDGIDGFGGGVVLLTLVTCFFLQVFSGSGMSFPMVLVVLAVPGLLQFLSSNWHPARIFLGDNGSLSLGFLVGMAGLVPAQPEFAFTATASLLIMMAYPILDMGLCVARRAKSGYPIFKADRSHLHHRVQRLGLTVPQTTTLLLCAVSYFQLSALLVHLVHPRLAVLVGASSLLALLSILYLIRCLEAWQRQNLLLKALDESYLLQGEEAVGAFASVVQVDLRPLLEVGLWEERGRAEALVSELVGRIQRMVRASDCLVLSEQKIKIYLHSEDASWENRTAIESRIRGELRNFQSTFGIQYSLEGLPIRSLEIRRKEAVA